MFPSFFSGHLYGLNPAGFRLWTKPEWKDFRWSRFQVAIFKSFCIGLFVHMLKPHPAQSISLPFFVI